MTTTSHYHRCKECRERMFDACTDPTCSIGVRWVVLCMECYEKLSGEDNDDGWAEMIMQGPAT